MIKVRGNLEEKVFDFIKSHSLFDNKEKVLVGFSGGGDSLALLHILINLPLNLEVYVFHLNHLLRGEESFRDEERVKEICKKFSLPLFLERRDILKEKRKNESLEEAARRIRFKVLTNIAKGEKIEKIVLGHQLDDQIETFLFRLLKGTSLKGLSGIHVKSERDGVEIIRPLLPFSRKEIDSYLAEKNLSSVEDSSNFNLKIPRNFIRHKILPLMEKINPNFKGSIFLITELLKDDEKYFSHLISSFIKEHYHKNEIVIPMEKLLNLPKSILYRLIKEIFHSFGEKPITFGKIEEVEKIINSARPNIFKDFLKIKVIREYDKLTFKKKGKEKKISYNYLLQCPGKIYIPEIRGEIESRPSSREDINFSNPYKVFLNAENMKFPLIVRTRKNGDRFHPLGLKKEKKLKDFLIDKKIPIKERNSLPLILSNEKIAWIVGIEISEVFKIDENTSKIISLTFKKL